MATSLPLLVFPQAKSIPPPKGQPVVIGQPHVPGHGKQAVRLGSQLTALQQEFDRYKVSVSSSVAGLEELVLLVIRERYLHLLKIKSPDQATQLLAALGGAVAVC